MSILTQTSSHVPPLNPRLAGVSESLICEMTRLANRLDALNLAEGLPDFPPPPQVLEALARVLRDQPGCHQSANPHGLPALREALSDYLAHHYRWSPDPVTEMTITTGATEGLYLALAATLQAGDEALLLAPFYEPYWPTLTSLGVKSTVVELPFPTFSLEVDRIEAAITPRTQLLILNSPCNPTGKVFSSTELEALAHLAQKHNLWVLSDEVYDQLTFDEHRHIPFASLPGMAERTLTLYSVSKTFSATGWRVGAVIAPPAATAAIRALHDCTTGGAPAPFQSAAAECFRLPAGFYQQVKEGLNEKRVLLQQALVDNGWDVAPAQGAYYLWTKVPEGQTDLAVTQQLIETVGISVVPGRCFFSPEEPETGYLRWCFGKRIETLSEAVNRF